MVMAYLVIAASRHTDQIAQQQFLPSRRPCGASMPLLPPVGASHLLEFRAVTRAEWLEALDQQRQDGHIDQLSDYDDSESFAPPTDMVESAIGNKWSDPISAQDALSCAKTIAVGSVRLALHSTAAADAFGPSVVLTLLPKVVAVSHLWCALELDLGSAQYSAQWQPSSTIVLDASQTKPLWDFGVDCDTPALRVRLGSLHSRPVPIVTGGERLVKVGTYSGMTGAIRARCGGGGPDCFVGSAPCSLTLKLNCIILLLVLNGAWFLP